MRAKEERWLPPRNARIPAEDIAPSHMPFRTAGGIFVRSQSRLEFIVFTHHFYSTFSLIIWPSRISRIHSQLSQSTPDLLS